MREDRIVSGEIFGRRWKMTGSSDMWGPVVSGRGRVPVRAGFLGHGLFSILGQFVAPWPFCIFSYFLLFLFCFLISFITFDFAIQMTSNQLLKLSKIQNINTKQ
jgi:hypothetical protein